MLCKGPPPLPEQCDISHAWSVGSRSTYWILLLTPSLPASSTGLLKLAQVKGFWPLEIKGSALFYDGRRSQKCILEPYRLTSKFHSKIGLTKPDFTVRVDSLPHRKWKETKQQPSMLPGPAVPGCCLVSFHFLWAILCPQAVHQHPNFTLKLGLVRPILEWNLDVNL